MKPSERPLAARVERPGLDGEPPPLNPYMPLIINAAITGMVPTKEETPHVPHAKEIGRPVATPTQAREMLGLPAVQRVAPAMVGGGK